MGARYRVPALPRAGWHVIEPANEYCRSRKFATKPDPEPATATVPHLESRRSPYVPPLRNLSKSCDPDARFAASGRRKQLSSSVRALVYPLGMQLEREQVTSGVGCLEYIQPDLRLLLVLDPEPLDHHFVVRQGNRNVHDTAVVIGANRQPAGVE